MSGKKKKKGSPKKSSKGKQQQQPPPTSVKTDGNQLVDAGRETTGEELTPDMADVTQEAEIQVDSAIPAEPEEIEEEIEQVTKEMDAEVPSSSIPAPPTDDSPLSTPTESSPPTKFIIDDEDSSPTKDMDSRPSTPPPAYEDCSVFTEDEEAEEQEKASPQQTINQVPEIWEDEINEFLSDGQDGAEARLAARRIARAEAREIRMKELEKQQKESDENADKNYDMYAPPSPAIAAGDVVNRAAFRVAVSLGNHRTNSVGSASYHSSRRSSEDSSEDGVTNLRELRHDLKELEEKFRKAMVQNAQMDNEKSALVYQVELLKDKMEDLEESQSLLHREHRDKCRDFENLKRLSTQIKDDLEYNKSQLHERDTLIKEYGLVLVENEVEVEVEVGVKEIRIKRALVSQETANVLSTLGNGSLDVRLSKVLEEKNELVDEIRRLKLDLEEERNRNLKGGSFNNNITNNHVDEENETEISKQLADYRFKTQKYEQEIATLQANVTRLDTQVQRFKTAAEEAEAREDDLKVERRKIQRELREAQSKLDELETTNSHLQKRLDKLKTAKSTLLKEL